MQTFYGGKFFFLTKFNKKIFFHSAKSQNPTMTNIIHNAHMDILQNLAVDLDNEGRYLFLNAIANQLRYPNIHTHYFSCALLYLFDEANSEAIQVGIPSNCAIKS